MNRRQEGYRFSVVPLEEAVQQRSGGRHPSNVLGVSGSSWAMFRHEGLSAFQADRLAVRIGLHPASIWADWFVGASELDEVAL